MRTLACLLMLGLATAALAPSTAGHPVDAGIDVKLYLNRTQDGGIGLTSLAPSARNATTWTASGEYHSYDGLTIEIPLEDPNPNWVVDESKDVEGWVEWSFTQQKSGGLLSPFQGSSYGSFSWLLVEGERSAKMTAFCAKPNESYSYDCDETRYRASFPGHGDKATPHTHGDGDDAERGLMSGDLVWTLNYKVPPCTSYQCSLGGSYMRYQFSIVLDGSTFLHYVAIDEDHPLEAPANETDVGNETATNETADGNETADPEGGPGGNETEDGNETGNGSAGEAFRPRPYSQGAEGTAPGAGIGAILASVATVAVLARRRRD